MEQNENITGSNEKNGEKNLTKQTNMMGLTVNLKDGRITIFKRTLEALGWPEYYRFLYNPVEQMIAIQSCGIDDRGAHRTPQVKTGDSCEMTCKDMVRLLYRDRRWNRKLSYRMPGISYPEHRLVNFELEKAKPLHEEKLI